MRWIDPPDGRPWALLGLCGASLLLNVVLIGHDLLAPDAAAEVAPPAAATAQATADASPADTDAHAAADLLPGEAAPAVAEGATPATGDAAPAAAPPVVPDGLRVVHAAVSENLAHTFQVAAPEHADVLAAVYARLFFWDLNLRRDLQKGDELSVVYSWDGQLAHIPAATYTSHSLGKTLHAYRFQATGDDFPSWWDEDGQEVARRLNDGPLDTYEQVTSLIRDRPNHKGMDFKTPEGTLVHAPKIAVVTRTNWNTRFNGDCIELRYGDGTIAKFLHLSKVEVRPGQHVCARQTIGLSGNTGHSTAPHLHYQLEQGERVIDPVDYHGTYRRTLPAQDRPGFEAEVRRLDAMLASET